jgi:hypothetical protein
MDADGIPRTAAQLCIGSNATRHCYAPPTQAPPFGLNPKTRSIRNASGTSLVLFTAESWAGGSGSLTILALLDISDARLKNLLPELKVTNQSEYHLWNLPSISAMPVLVTADYVWADGETHFARHRYRVTSFVYDKQAGRYLQRDQYVTGKKYPGLDAADEIKVLEPERASILAKLQRR